MDKKTEKHIQQLAKKRMENVDHPKSFQQNYKTSDGNIITYTPQHAGIQTRDKRPRLLRNSGLVFVANPKTY